MTRINIDDDMIERAAKRQCEVDCGPRGWESASKSVRENYLDVAFAILQAALDRRTGPKDRRVEIDDLMPPMPTRRCIFRRAYDGHWNRLPRKSDRLKREAEEREKQKAQEIHVSHQMISEGAKAYEDHGFMFRKGSTSQGVIEFIYRAMRLQEMKERGDA